MFGKHSRMQTESERKRRFGAGKLLALVGLGTAAYMLREPAAQWLAQRRRELSSRVRAAVQDTLRRVIGATVEWDALTISPLSGVYEARGVRVVADGADHPVLRIDRIRAEVMMGRTLLGEIRVRQAMIERPVISIMRQMDGQTNLPALARDASDAVQKAKRTAEMAKSAADVAGRMAGWGLALRVDHASVAGGQLHYRDASLGDYRVSAEPIQGRMWRQSNGYGYEIDITSIGRRDAEGDLGAVHEQGELTGSDNLLALADMGLWAEGRIAQDVRAQIRCERLGAGQWQVHMDGSAALTKMAQFLPERVPGLEALRGVEAHGEMDVQVRLEYSREQGLRVPQAVVQARNVGVEPQG